jgi:hypothetical protein
MTVVDLSLSANRPRFAGHSEETDMPKLKLGPITDDKPVKVTLDLPATLHRDLVAYAAALAREQGQPIPDPTKLIAPMLARFMAAGRGFAKARRAAPSRPASETSSDNSGRSKSPAD